MSRSRFFLAAIPLGILALLTLALCRYVTRPLSNQLDRMEWSSMEAVQEDGTSAPFDPYLEWPEASYYRFTGQLPSMEELPDLYTIGYIALDYSNADMTVLIDGVEYLHTTAPMRNPLTFSQGLRLAVPPEAAGKELTLLYTPDEAVFFAVAPAPYYSTDSLENISGASVSAGSLMMSGASAVIFLLIAFLFFYGVGMREINMALIPLGLATLSLFLKGVSDSTGYWILPRWFYNVASHDLFPLATILLVVLYLILNRKEARPWLILLILLGSGTVAGLFLLISESFRIRSITLLLLSLKGQYRPILSFAATYSVLVCSGLAAYLLIRRQMIVRDRMTALNQRYHAIQDNYRMIDQSVQTMTAMRHEWKNQLSAIRLMAQQGNLEELSRYLDQTGEQLSRRMPRQYSKHFAINAILQNSALQAEEQGILFTAAAGVSPTIPVDDADLCTILINMLDNALRGAASAPPSKRELTIFIRVHEDLLEIRCENTWSGELREERDGVLRSTKRDSASHGLGIAMMQQAARRYRGTVEVTHTKQLFTTVARLHMDLPPKNPFSAPDARNDAWSSGNSRNP